VRAIVTAWQRMPLMYIKGFKVGDLHEEWRLILFAVLFGTASALVLLIPQAVPIIAVLLIILLLLSLWRNGVRSYLSLLALGTLFAVFLSAARLSEVERQDFRPEQYVSAVGVVDQLEFRPEKSTRLIIAVSHLNGFRGTKTPSRVRLAVRTQIEPGVAVGSTVHLNAIISPNGGALVPGGYDFGRAAAFQNIDARGYATSTISLETGALDSGLGLKTRIDKVRYSLANEIQSAVPGQPGALAVALTLGLRHRISDETSEILRRAGLSHLLAISGLHMGIVAAAAFFMFELLFAAIPSVALRVMPRRLAVAPAWLLAAAYLLLSGGSTATVRAFIMVSVAMLALLTGRRVLSLRSVALAALAIMVIWPYAVLSVGFQMSFAATTGLIAFYERVAGMSFFKTPHSDMPLWRRGLRVIFMIGVTSFVAQVSVAPFALYHFQALSVVGIVANILVLPIISFAVMPLLFVTLLLAPFSSAVAVGWLLHSLLDLVMDIATLTAAPAFSVLRINPMAELTLLVLTVAFLTMVLLSSRKGLVCAAFLLGLTVLIPPGSAVKGMVSSSGSVIAVLQGQTVALAGGRQKSFRVRSWQRYWGLDPFQATSRLAYHGDRAARRYQLDEGLFLTRINSLSAVRASCASGDVIIIDRKYMRYCKGAALMLEKEMLAKQGPAGLQWQKAERPTVIWANPLSD